MAGKQIAGLDAGTPIRTDLLVKQDTAGSSDATKITLAQALGLIQVGDLPDLSATYQAVSEKDQASGYAGLNASAKLPDTTLSDNVMLKTTYDTDTDGKVDVASGGTDQDFSTATGYIEVASGVMSVQANPLPSGTILAYGGTSAPTGYLFCNGAAVSRTTYANLFAVIGTAYGFGDESTTFNVPDLRGRFLRGQDEAQGRDPDAATRTASATGGNTGDNLGSGQDDAVQGHHHRVEDDGPTYLLDASTTQAGSDARPTRSGSWAANRYAATLMFTDGTNGTPRVTSETRPANVYVRYIIAI